MTDKSELVPLKSAPDGIVQGGCVIVAVVVADGGGSMVSLFSLHSFSNKWNYIVIFN